MPCQYQCDSAKHNIFIGSSDPVLNIVIRLTISLYANSALSLEYKASPLWVHYTPYYPLDVPYTHTSLGRVVHSTTLSGTCMINV